MSPEQVRGEPVDARSDIFSFGCVLYELMTGKGAFHAKTSVETMNAILNQDPPEMDANTAQLAPAIGAIVRRCLEKRPEQRFQSAADLAFALRSVGTTSSTGLHAAAATTSPKKSRRGLWIAAGVAAAASLVGAGFVADQWTGGQAPQSFQRITFRKGFVQNARFTPDGRNIVFQATWEGGPSRIYLAVPGSPEARDLGLAPDNQLLAISSKQDLAYVDAAGHLMRGSISGGRMRPLLYG
jgi:hypothetical protein